MSLSDLLHAPWASIESNACRLSAAEVIGASEGNVTLSLEVVQIDAQIAVLDYLPQVGDKVLVAGSESDGHFVIGVLSTAAPRQPMLVRNPETGGAALVVEQGDLEIQAPNGAVRINSGTGLQATSSGAIDFCSRVAVRLSVLSGIRGLLSRFRLEGREAGVQGQRTVIETNTLRVQADNADLAADRMTAEAGAAELTAERTKLNTGVLVTTVQNAYQRVSGLWQLVADRTRTVVRGISHHSAKRLYSKADDVKVKSDKIHLG